jgi:hypothetical protein
LSKCRHCCKNKIHRPRGLCWRCYYTLEINALYVTESKFGRRSYPDFYGSAPLPDPTDARPGTPEKVAVMEERANRGESIFHPEDAK